MVFNKWLQALGKLEYVQGKDRPNVDCILCAVRDNDKRVKSLKFYEDDLIFVCLNLFPYNPAHSLIVVNRHIETFLELTKAEIERIFRAIQGLQMMLEDLYSPHGYNIGFNLGSGGASIPHLHCHLVPRYGSELGFIDIIGETRVVVEDLTSVMKKMKDNVHNYLTEDFFRTF
ncbi:MAG: HIT family protein [Promethearchaeota archaeon]